MTTGPVASVVIPAHNEQNVIGRCLEMLLEHARAGEFEVVVAANGCTDDTVRIARRFEAAGVRVVETSTASKIAALNLGDGAATAFPRIYLDADAVITTEVARALVAALDEADGPLAVAPLLHLDLSRCSRPARAYLATWQSLPVFQQSYVGSGCYALSARGRARFAAFPDVLGDDRFVNAVFSRDEKRTLADQKLVVRGPHTLRSIIRRSLRVRSGSRSLDSAMAASGHAVRDAGRGEDTKAHLQGLLSQPGRRGPAVLFTGVSVYIRLAARVRDAAGKRDVWLRDETSRT